jgi:hypothetical protein
LSTPNDVQVKLYSTLAELPAAYDDVFAAGAARSFYLSRPWFANLVATACPPHEQPRLYGIERDDRTALGLLFARGRPPRLRQPMRQLSGYSSMYTILYGPLWASVSAALAGAPALAQRLAAERPRWDIVQLDSLDPDSAEFSHLQSALRAAGYVVQPYFHFGNWFESITEPSWDIYWQRRPSILRNTVSRKSKKLLKAHRVRYQIYTGGQNLDEGITAYDRVYAASWKIPEPFPAFAGGLVRCAADVGALRLGIAYVDDRPAAAQIWLVANRQATIFKLAYDEAFAAHSIGTLLTVELARHVIEIDRVSDIDFGRGDDPYKRDWLAQRRERWGIIALNPRTAAGAFAVCRHLGARLLKRVAAQALPTRQRSD